MEKKQRGQKDPNEKQTLCYIQPDKPLAFNFYDATLLEELLDKEPTSGTKLEKKEEEKKENKVETQNDLNQTNQNNQDEEVKPKKKLELVEQFEGSLTADNNTGGKKLGESKAKGLAKTETKKDEQKKKMVIKYKKYTNSVNVANNKLTTIEGMRAFLEAVLPELTFNSKIGKVDLIQWIDISRNKLKEIHKEIAELPYLKILYVHGNNIQEIEHVVALANCKSLTSLTLYGNPIDHIKGYRHFIIEMCPILEKFDSAVISEKELDIIKFRGSRYGEVRNKAGKVLKYPKLPEEIIKTIKMAEESQAEKKEDN